MIEKRAGLSRRSFVKFSALASLAAGIATTAPVFEKPTLASGKDGPKKRGYMERLRRSWSMHMPATGSMWLMVWPMLRPTFLRGVIDSAMTKCVHICASGSVRKIHQPPDRIITL